MFNALRNAISDDHVAIEKTPYAIALAEGSIGRDDYCFGLAQLYHIHAALENAASEQADLQPFFDEPMVRTNAVKRDLLQLGHSLDEYAVLPQTQAAIDAIEQLVEETPFALLAHIYVLEGSRMGSMVLTKPIARALNVDPSLGQGIDYHVEGARETPLRLKAWKEAVSEAVWSIEELGIIVDSAGKFMHDLCVLYAALPANGFRDQCVA